MVRAYSRLNGWVPPPHPLQVMAWVMVLYLAATTFGVLVPSVASFSIRVTTYVVMAAIILVNIIANFVVTTIDPSDVAVKKKIRNNPRPTFDRSRNEHVIDENYFCNICEAFIQPSSKHCRQCNKCVLNFDHHCKWLNNCIGSKNYRWFLFYIVSTALTAFCIFALGVTLFVLHFVDEKVLYQENGSLMVYGRKTVSAVWLAFVGTSTITSAVATVLVLHLLFFHLRIINKGLTTYNYIMEQKKREEDNEKRKSDIKAKRNAPSGEARLFSQPKAHPSNGMANGSGSKAKSTLPHEAGGQKLGRFERLKKLLRLRLEQLSSRQNTNGLISVPQGGAHTHVPENLTKSGRAPNEELMVSNASEESIGQEKRAVSRKSPSHSTKTNKERTTPLPPITRVANGVPNRKPTAISNFIQITDIAGHAKFSEKKRKHGVPSSVIQSEVPYEIMEDKENRISVSHVAATLPSENGGKVENRVSVDSTAATAYSRHASVPRLPPLPSVGAGQPGKAPPTVSAFSKPPEGTSLQHALSSDLTASLASTASTMRKDDDNLKEIPLASFSKHHLAHRSPTGEIPVRSGQRASSGSSTTSSGSTLAPLQVEALANFAKQGGGKFGLNSNAFAGQYLSHNQRLRLMTGRHAETMASLVDDHDSRVSQCSDNGSVSSGSKRVRFNAHARLSKE